MEKTGKPVSGEIRSWDRQEGEPLKAWNIFLTYRDLGIKRTVYKAAQVFGQEYNTKYWQSVASKWHWTLRCEDYDRHLDQISQEVKEQEVISMVKRHTQIALAMQNKIIDRFNTLTPNMLSADTLIRWLESSIKIERLSRGMNTDSVRTEAKTEVEIDLGKLEDKDLETLRDLAKKIT